MQNTVAMSDIALVDIRDVTVDKELPREERIAEFVRQIKNPYVFKCGKFTVRTSFAPDGAIMSARMTVINLFICIFLSELPFAAQHKNKLKNK